MEDDKIDLNKDDQKAVDTEIEKLKNLFQSQEQEPTADLEEERQNQENNQQNQR